MRNVARHHVQQVDRVVAAFDPNVDVLAEDGELLGEVAVEGRDALETLGREDAPLRPLVERMRAAARQHYVDYLRAFIRRDHNHPSVFCWSVGNACCNSATIARRS